MKKHIPNILTLLNLLSGCIAVVFLLSGGFAEAAIMITAALVFDFLDGFTARWLKAYSEIGKELDSLADMVSFGLVPGIVMYKLLIFSGNAPTLGYHGLDLAGIPAFLITLMSALRLAIFNLDDTQSNNFKGLPTPANAIFFVSLPLVLSGGRDNFITDLFQTLAGNYIVLLVMVIISSFLLVSPIRLLSLKIKTGDRHDNIYRVILAIVSVAGIMVWGITALPLIIVFYILLSIIWQWQGTKNKNTV